MIKKEKIVKKRTTDIPPVHREELIAPPPSF